MLAGKVLGPPFTKAVRNEFLRNAQAAWKSSVVVLCRPGMTMGTAAIKLPNSMGLRGPRWQKGLNHRDKIGQVAIMGKKAKAVIRIVESSKSLVLTNWSWYPWNWSRCMTYWISWQFWLVSSFEQVHQPRAPWMRVSWFPLEKYPSYSSSWLTDTSPKSLPWLLIVKILDYGLRPLTPWTTYPWHFQFLISLAPYVSAP